MQRMIAKSRSPLDTLVNHAAWSCRLRSVPLVIAFFISKMKTPMTFCHAHRSAIKSIRLIDSNCTTQVLLIQIAQIRKH
jgi:hypothetical protein